MRIYLVALAVSVAIGASAQPTFSVGTGGGGGGDCREVLRQIARDWFDVQGVFGGTKSEMHPDPDGFRCVSPDAVRDAMPRRTVSQLKCFKIQGGGVCCDPQMQACATR